MSIDRRLTRDLNLVADELTSIAKLAAFLATHLRDAQSLAFDQKHPDTVTERKDPITGKVISATLANDNARRMVSSLKTEVGKIESALVDQAAAMRKLFSGPRPDAELRGTLLGWYKGGQFVPHSANLELGRLLKAQGRREERAARTGETTHARLEPQLKAPKVQGADPHEERARQERRR